MADKKISELPVATTPLAGTEKAEIVQGGVNKQVDVSEFGSGGTSTPYGATTGTNAYSATMSPVVSAYADGQMYHIRVGNSSTGLVTIDLGPGAKKAFDTSGAQIQDGYLKAGVDYVIVYNSTLDAAAGGFTVVNEVIHGFMNLRATYTTGTGLWPSTGGSGPSSGIRHGDTFIAGSNMTLGAKVVNTGDFITTMVDSPGQTDASWFVIPGPASLALKQTLINSAVALVDGASIDLTAIKHTLTTASSRTFTITYTGDDIAMRVTLNATSSVFTFPAGTKCINSNGSASGDNTCALSGTSGSTYVFAIKNWGGGVYTVVSKNEVE